MRVKTCVGYVRESTQEQGQNWAPDVQRKAIARYAKEQGWELAEIYQDFISGRKADKRPDFQRLVSDAKARRFDAVLVYHSSRFARNVSEARQFKELLRAKLGIDVISTSQRFGEQDDPTNFLMEGINETLDEHYSRNLGFLVAAGLREKQQQGYLTGSVPFGYHHPPGEKNTVEIVPEEAEIVRLVFERYATGRYSYRELADWINAQGYRGRRGRPLSKESVYEWLSNGVFAGYVGPRRGPIDPAARGHHDPIIERALWDRVQAVRAKRSSRRHGTRPSKHTYVLSGTAVCQRCGAKIYGSLGGNGNRFARYLCSTRHRHKKCDQPQAQAAVLEGELSDFLRTFQLSEPMVQATITRLHDRAGKQAKVPGKASITELRGRLARVKDLYELGDLSRDEFLKRKAKVVALMADAEPLAEVNLDRAIELLHNFPDLWDGEPDPKERQRFVQLVFDRIDVEAGHVVAVQPRSTLLPLFTEREGVQSGSDGTRTRDLRRDRPAL